MSNLESLDPEEAEWPRRTAECYGALKRKKDQAEALVRAATRFDKARVPNKAEALCLLALSVDPANQPARSLLTELERVREETWRMEVQASAQRVGEPSVDNASAPSEPRLELALRRARGALFSVKK